MRSSWGSRFERFVHNNVEATQRLLEALRATPGTRLVYASSSSIYGESQRLPTPRVTCCARLSPMALTKQRRAGCRSAPEPLGLDTRRCSPSPSTWTTAAQAARWRSCPLPKTLAAPAARSGCSATAASRRDFTYVADVVSAIRAAGSGQGAGGRAYNIGGGSPVSLNAALEQLAAIAGRPLDVTRAERESGDVLNTAADTSRARARSSASLPARPSPRGCG